MSTKSNTERPECWSVDPQARGLRVVRSLEHSLVLPFEHFIYSELEAGADEEVLKVTFATHEVILKGSRLDRLEAALQRFELGTVAPASGKFERVASQTQPFVREIVILKRVRNDGDAGGVSAGGQSRR
ncbi:MAG: hypothetical protein KGS61_12350 [Verrucomicrobia bacterium]|nr:hypothetical protein [Verrucomicrobiota bacterium]